VDGPVAFATCLIGSSGTDPFRPSVAFCGGPFCALSASPRPKTMQPGSASQLMNAERKSPRRLAPSTRNRGSWLPVTEEWIRLAMSVENAGSNGLVRARQQIGLTT
jgi:hypothetical protein